MPLPASDHVDLLFRAFADRTRLRILNLLCGRDEICVCDLMRVLELPQARISRHLAYLRKAGLVLARKEQQWMHYRLSPRSGAFHSRLLDCLACCFGEVPMLKRDRDRLERSCGVAKGACCEP